MDTLVSSRRELLHLDSPSQQTYSSHQPKLAQNLTEALGIVPIVRLSRLGDTCRRQDLYIKLESCNPGGSIKEKNAAYLIVDAEEKGLLQPGGTIVESSSGNFGIGLAMIGASRGYRVIIVVDAKTPPPMRRILGAYGAELVDVSATAADAQGSMQVARMQRAAVLAREIPGAWYPCQHLNPLNLMAHHLHTAREIEAAFDGPPDAIVVGISTAGQIGGLGRYFARRYPSVALIGVDVSGSAILGTPRHSYKMTGLGLSFVPPYFDPSTLEAAYSVSDQLAFSMCRFLAKKEGLLVGASTGAIVAAGLAYGAGVAPGRRIVMINPDRGDRYLETVFDDDWLSAQGVELLGTDGLTGAVRDLRPVPKRLYRAQEGSK